ncbi:MAG TPA: transglutaminase family protein [Candidatus Saccharimonadales bacterium]|nr:transglutaminase family protein [Candidatus Saccharimonadales bacterium]
MNGRPDWSRVTRATYRVRQHYRYEYTGPVWDLHQRLVMIPPDQHGDQRLLQHDLAIRGTEGDHATTWERDAFGNRVARVVANRVPVAIDFEATYRVERVWVPPGVTAPAPWTTAAGRLEYVRPTALTAPDRRLIDQAEAIARKSGDGHERAERAHDWTAGAIDYQYGITGYTTPAAMALHLGKGVCQDYAHILLALLRMLNVPCRYVSGQLLGEGAAHAWVEALIDTPGNEVEVVAYDPTHRRRARLDYLTVAVGRDFADVSPTSGTYSGPAAGRISSTKRAEAVEIEVAPDSAEAVA